jgi:hypothetical protein
LPFWEGPIVVTVGSNMWFFPQIGYREHPEATKRVFRFGICQAGFGYFQTSAALEADGRLTVGRGFLSQRRESSGSSPNSAATDNGGIASRLHIERARAAAVPEQQR